MRIKQLQVTGFKSFLDKTTVSFDVPITGIVGPNGCGKSNVVDALKWVTGELRYKELRGKNSEDLIFAGSERRPPSSMMEVALTLDNTEKKAPTEYNEFSEITVIRRIFRDGSSEFFINKTPCRLRDITDLFLDTGIGQSSYSIIEQGKVGAIVSGRPEDRRLMIEEAAGITKYKHRKKAALRKMDSTKQNLLRVSDIVKELEKQIASLERQAKKAEKFRVAKESFESLDIQLTAHEYNTYQSQKNDLIEKDEALHLNLTTLETSLSDIEANFESKRVELDEVENIFQQSQQDLFTKKSDIQAIEHEITSCKNSIEHSEKQCEIDAEKIIQLSQDVENSQKRFEVITTELSAIDESKATFQQELEQKKGLFDEQKGQLSMIESALDEAKKKHIGLVTSRTECKSKIDSLKSNIVNVEKDMGKTTESLASVVDEVAQTETQALDVKTTYDQVKQMCFGFQENQQKIADELIDTEALKMNVENQLSKVQRVMQEKESRLKALTEFTKNYQGYTKTVQNIMKKHHNENHFAGIEGVLGELVHIEEGYEKCLQAVLSDWIESIVVDDISSVTDLVSYLKDDQKSRAMVLTSATIEGNEKTIQHSLVRGTLDKWVKVDGSAQGSILSKLQSVYVVENLQALIEVSQSNPGKHIVTLEGDYLESTGMLHVGPWNEAHGDLEVRQEIESLSIELEPLQKQYRDLSEEKETVGRKFDQLKRNLEQIEADIKKESQRSSELGMKLQKIEDKVGFLIKQKAQHLEQTTAYKLKIDSADQEIQKLQQVLVDAEGEIGTLEAEIASKSSSYQQSKDDFENYQKEIHDYQLKLASILERSESLGREKIQTEKSIANGASQKQRLVQEVKNHTENITTHKQRIEEFEKKMSESIGLYENQEHSNSGLKVKHEQLAEVIRQMEGKLKTVRQNKEELQNKINDVRVHVSEVSVKMENLQNQTQEIYEKELLHCIFEIQNDENAFELDAENLDSYRAQREELKIKVQRFGNVNLAAIDEIEELKERFGFLTAQQQDLEKSLATLLDAIKTINKTTKEKFEVTYKEVNERFQKIFPRLFRGGKARLNMTDPENILETGIDIFAQPPGKKLQNMNLLSGGEKALTAISLLFAIFEYKAPPFCVLDEVDAPLDDANVLRYVAMVKEMSEKTQFIVITHNKGSMQMANNLYGVTMEEPGVSRTVSVRLDQENVHDEKTIFEAKSVA